MVEKTGNKWQKLPAVAEAFSKLLLPLVIAGLGVVFGYIQHRADVEQRKADRVTSFITHLASTNDKEREIAIRVMNVLIEKNQLPTELNLALFSSADDSNETISQLSQAALTSLAKTDTSLEKKFAQEVERNPELEKKVQARVFIHINTKLAQEGQFEIIGDYLETKGYIVPEIQKVNVFSKKTQLRYFRENEKKQVDEIIKHLLDLGFAEVDDRIFRKYASSTRPRTYELWLGSSDDYERIFENLMK